MITNENAFIFISVQRSLGNKISVSMRFVNATKISPSNFSGFFMLYYRIFDIYAERRNSTERKKFYMSLIETKRKVLYPFCGYFNLVSKQEFSTFRLTEFCREDILIGRNFMIYAKSLFFFDASKSFCCNYKLA